VERRYGHSAWLRYSPAYTSSGTATHICRLKAGFLHVVLNDKSVVMAQRLAQILACIYQQWHRHPYLQVSQIDLGIYAVCPEGISDADVACGSDPRRRTPAAALCFSAPRSCRGCGRACGLVAPA